MYKKLLFILLLTLTSLSGYSQTVFTQTFVDRCTGDVKIVTANFVNGSATVAFYDKIKVFTYNQYLNGELQAWLVQTYQWWQALSPCSSTTQQTQQAQQTAQNAQQAAQAAQSASSSASSAATAATSAVTPPPSTNTTTGGTTNATSGTTGTTNNTSQSSSTNTSSSSSSSSSSSESSQTSSGGTSSEGGTTESSGGGETSSGEGGTTEKSSEGTESKTEETKTEESKTEESKTEESKEETKEEVKEESKEEEKKEETKEEEKSEEEKKEEKEKEKEEKKEEKKQKKEEKKKQRVLLPIQLKADMMAMQNPLGGYNSAINFGASQSSIFGDVSYSANLMVFDNLKQATLALGRTKIYMDDSYNVDWIESMGLSYGNNFGTQSTAGNFMRLKPMGTKGTIGLGVNYTFMFGGMLEKPMGSMGYNLLYTNTYVRPDGRWTYSPAFIISQTPLSFTLDRYSNISGDAMFILANSFTYRITKRFTVNFGYTAIKSTNPLIPLINSFMIGSKLPF